MDAERIERISRRIAESFEPEPKFSLAGKWHLSLGGYWQSFQYSDVRTDAAPLPFTSPEIAMRLLKEIMRQNTNAALNVFLSTGVTIETLEEAIALAFCGMKGIDTA